MFDKIDTYIALGRDNRYYFTGIDTSFGCVILTQNEKVFVTDFRYEIEARSKLPDFKVISTTGGKFYDLISNEIGRLKSKVVGYEDDVLTVREHKDLKSNLEDVTLKSAGAEFKELRAIKTAAEVENVVAAQRIAEKALSKVKSSIKVGVTEREIAAQLIYEMIRNGAEKESFDPIVAFGRNAAKPHHHPGDKKLEKGECVLLDYGAKYKGYCSDMSRTFCVGEPPKKLREIYEIVLKAQEYALKHIRAGMSGHEADSLAREIISANGYDAEFGHSLGHGLGIEIHETPRVSKNSTDIITPGMIITVEPGIYIEEFGGVRIEDMLLIKEDGNVNLTNFDKDLEI